MENNFLEFFYYLVTTIHKDMNSFIIVLFLVLGSFFSVKLLWKNTPSILRLTGNLIGLAFIIFGLFVLVIFLSIPAD